jgi:hypothetical protein
MGLTKRQLERDAWGEYLRSTKGEPLWRYDEIELAAWARLEKRLSVIARAAKTRKRAKAIA